MDLNRSSPEAEKKGSPKAKFLQILQIVAFLLGELKSQTRTLTILVMVIKKALQKVKAMVKLLGTLNGTFTLKYTQKFPVINNISLHCENSFPRLALNFFHLRIGFQIYTDTLKIPTKQKILFIEQH